MSNRESTEQGRSGRRGAEAERTSGRGDQARQGSRRVEEQTPEEEPKHHFERGHAPSEQGETDSPSPNKIAQHQQGVAGAGTGRKGSNGSGTDRSEETARGGSPSGGHTRHGRQQVTGDRQPDE